MKLIDILAAATVGAMLTAQAQAQGLRETEEASPAMPSPALPGEESFFHDVEEAPAFWIQGTLWIMLASAEETGGRFSMTEQLLARGGGAPPHLHPWSDETFYVLDGTITFLIEDEIATLGPGTFVNVARNRRHAFRVDSATARILNGWSPAGMERVASELGEPATARTLPPPAPASVTGEMPPDQLARYGVVWLVEPDPLRPLAGDRD